MDSHEYSHVPTLAAAAAREEVDDQVTDLFRSFEFCFKHIKQGYMAILETDSNAELNLEESITYYSKWWGSKESRALHGARRVRNRITHLERNDRYPTQDEMHRAVVAVQRAIRILIDNRYIEDGLCRHLLKPLPTTSKDTSRHQRRSKTRANGNRESEFVMPASPPAVHQPPQSAFQDRQDEDRQNGVTRFRDRSDWKSLAPSMIGLGIVVVILMLGWRSVNLVSGFVDSVEQVTKERTEEQKEKSRELEIRPESKGPSSKGQQKLVRQPGPDIALPYLQDFSDVPEGSIPKKWQAPESIGVRREHGGSFVVPSGPGNITLRTPRVPLNKEFEVRFLADFSAVRQGAGKFEVKIPGAPPLVFGPFTSASIGSAIRRFTHSYGLLRVRLYADGVNLYVAIPGVKTMVASYKPSPAGEIEFRFESCYVRLHYLVVEKPFEDQFRITLPNSVPSLLTSVPSGALPRDWSGSPAIAVMKRDGKTVLKGTATGTHWVTSPDLHFGSDFSLACDVSSAGRVRRFGGSCRIDLIGLQRTPDFVSRLEVSGPNVRCDICESARVSLLVRRVPRRIFRIRIDREGIIYRYYLNDRLLVAKRMSEYKKFIRLVLAISGDMEIEDFKFGPLTSFPAVVPTVWAEAVRGMDREGFGQPKTERSPAHGFVNARAGHGVGGGFGGHERDGRGAALGSLQTGARKTNQVTVNRGSALGNEAASSTGSLSDKGTRSRRGPIDAGSFERRGKTTFGNHDANEKRPFARSSREKKDINQENGSTKSKISGSQFALVGGARRKVKKTGTANINKLTKTGAYKSLTGQWKSPSGERFELRQRNRDGVKFLGISLNKRNYKTHGIIQFDEKQKKYSGRLRVNYPKSLPRSAIVNITVQQVSDNELRVTHGPLSPITRRRRLFRGDIKTKWRRVKTTRKRSVSKQL